MAFKVDRIADLDREAIRESVIERFSIERMTDGYEAIYREMLARRPGGGRGGLRSGVGGGVPVMAGQDRRDDAPNDAGAARPKAEVEATALP